MATTVTLEKCGHNKGYKGLDNCRFCPGSQCCVEDGPESIDSIIDMDAVCKRVTTLGLDVSVTISQDAGRWAPGATGFPFQQGLGCNSNNFLHQLHLRFLCVAQIGLELTLHRPGWPQIDIYLLLPAECWDYHAQQNTSLENGE